MNHSLQLDEIPVLIVGAGPAGLVAASELARHGIETLLIERRRQGFDHPRATGISTWSMELLRSWGLEQDIRDGAVDVDWHGWRCETLSSPAGVAVPLGFPSREQSAAVSPTAPACAPQDHLEPVLLRYAQALGAKVQFNAELVGLQWRPDGLSALLRDADQGLRSVRARYVIGADGARSTVRGAIAVPMRGPGATLEAASVLFRAPLWRLLGERRYGLYPITHPEADGVFVPAGRGDRWIYGFVRDPAVMDTIALDPPAMARLIALGAGAPGLEPRIAQIRRFAFTAQLADRFRDGNTFLAGDAAHRVTPRGGTGMNMAIRDGYDLAWKLAWVLRGWADARLLDSYEGERRPVAEHNVARSNDDQGSAGDVADELQVDLGGRIPHAWVDTERGRLSTLDLLGPGLTLFTGPRAAQEPGVAPAVCGAAPVIVRRLPAVTARALGIGAADSLLVRPDGVPARVAEMAPAGARAASERAAPRSPIAA
jgi:putative polyketide hydroxylase